MSDTSSRTSFGGSGKRIRLNLKLAFGSTERSSRRTARQARTGGPPKPAAGKTKPDGGTVTPKDVKTIIWGPIDDDGRLQQLLLPPELIHYIREMARFIEKAHGSGVEAAAAAFGLPSTATFPSLRRQIRNSAPGNSESSRAGSEHHSRAGGAFSSGSARWAQDVARKDDPTAITLADLVARLASDPAYGRGLKESARLIIEEYLQRVIRSVFREDDPFLVLADDLIGQATRQIREFIAAHPAASAWEPARVRQTLAKLPPFLVNR